MNCNRTASFIRGKNTLISTTPLLLEGAYAIIRVI